MTNKKFTKIIDHFSIFIALLSLCGALMYRFFGLSTFYAFLTFLLSLTFYLTLVYSLNKVKSNSNEQIDFIKTKEIDNQANIKIKIISILYFCLILLSFLILFRSRSGDSIISPWQKVPDVFFILIFLDCLLLSLIIIYKSRIRLISIIIFSFLINAVAIIIYKYGFGFDFFIHQATMELIDQAGAVEPKPLYYIGQYSLIMVLHKLFFIPIFYLHLLLVPLLSSILIPLNLKRYFEQKGTSALYAYFTIFAITTLPLGIFFNTTPQNLAFLFLLLAIIRGLRCRNYFDLSYIYLFAIASFLIQPVAGIPAILLAIAIHIHHSDIKNIKKYLLTFVYLSASIALPLSFVILNRLNTVGSNSPLEGSTNSYLENIINNIKISTPNSENIFLNTIYFFNHNAIILITLTILFGIYFALKNPENRQIHNLYLFFSTAFLVSYIIITQVSFNFLIDYERSDYANRILIVSILFLFPFILIAIQTFIRKIQNKNIFIRINFFLFFLILIPIFIYLNYPRIDNYYNSHGYSVGVDDIEAVHFIENNSEDDYIVLANQQTSVAALREFGFNRYYKNQEGQDIFYYPIPTGGPLYPFFLDMVNTKPASTTMQAAMNLANVNTSYFVINKYWWAFNKIIEEAKLEADAWYEINNGNVYIFKFNKK